MARSEVPTDHLLTEMQPEAAYQAMLDDIAAVPDERAVTVNVDIPSAVTVVRKALPELRALRPQIVDELPRFDLQRFDRLEHYALAVSHAHTLHRSTSTAKGTISDLVNELSAIRDRLLTSAQSLVCFEMIDSARIKDCKRKNGHRATVAEVLSLIAAFKENWPQVEHKTPVTMALLEVAASRAVELLGVIGLKEQSPLASEEAALIRQKAFTLFLRSYEDARRAVAYLRHYAGDADDIAPSLYAGRGGRRPRDDQDRPPAPSAPREPPDNPHADDGGDERPAARTLSN